MNLRWQLKGLLRRSRPLWPDADEWLALEAYKGLVTQVFAQRPLNPAVAPLVWRHGNWMTADKGLKSPARRERDNASHHYGHDIQLKRHAGLPLVGRAIPWLLEHGLKVSPEATFEAPRAWSRGYLCMGPERAAWIRERHQQPTTAIGPWIAYARPLLDPDSLAELRRELGPTLLVVLAHSWGTVERQNDLPAAIEQLQRICGERGYRRVIWLKHWQDPAQLPLPADWIQACNGHRSNPWFLDALRTLLELCDGLASNSFGTHLGYGLECGCTLHWLDAASRQVITSLPDQQQKLERIEWQRRQELGQGLKSCGDDMAAATLLLEPFWGFSKVKDPASMACLLRGTAL